MQKTMVYLEPAQHAFLKSQSQRTGRSMADLVREAVDEYMKAWQPAEPDLSWIGSVEGPPEGDVSQRDEEILREIFGDRQLP